MEDFAWSEKESRRTYLQRRKLEREKEANEDQAFFQGEASNIVVSPFTALSRECTRKLTVAEGCAGLVIGKKGEHIRGVEQRCKVSVRIEDADAAETRGPGATRRGPRSGPQQIIISGPTLESVESAARELDFAFEMFEVSAKVVGWAVGKGGKHLKFIKELSGVSSLDLRRSGGDAAVEDVASNDVADDVGGPGSGDTHLDRNPSKPEHCWFEVKGQRYRVNDAIMLLDAHMGYFPVYEEMKESDRLLDKEIEDALAVFGQGSRRRSKVSFQGDNSRKGPKSVSKKESSATERDANAENRNTSESSKQAGGEGRSGNGGSDAGRDEAEESKGREIEPSSERGGTRRSVGRWRPGTKAAAEA